MVMVPYFMIKSFLILASFSIFAFSSQQIVLVVAKDFNTSQAKMECFEDGKKVFNTMGVNIGKNGLGWGLGEIKFHHNDKTEMVKKEGDKKAPIGIFKLPSVFGYEKKQNLNMPYIHASKDLICVDESSNRYYNKIIHMPSNKPKSFECMKRDDNQYRLGIVVEHNKQGIKQRGSCIFIHVQKAKNTPTAGCTSMSYNDLKKIVLWLDRTKNPILIQIPKSLANEIIKLYPELKSSGLLKED
jgi:hypothetical protein